MFSQTMIIGRLGKAPEVRFTQDNKAIGNFTVATDGWNGKDKTTMWHNIVVFGAQAENAEKYLQKGSMVAVVGEPQQETWDDKQTGEKKYKTVIKAHTVKFLDPKGDKPAVTETKSSAPAFDDDIPF